MDEITSILQICKNKSSNQQQNEFLLQPFDYVCKTSGQQIPLKLLHALNFWFDISSEKLNLIIEIVETLHNVSFLIDDIQDNSPSRQGSPVAHSIYGMASTLNAATYAFCIILEKLKLLNHPEATNVFLEEMQDMHRGQAKDIYWRDHFKTPTYLEYKLMAVQKMGSLYSIVARLIQLFSTKTIDVSNLIALMGIYLQVWDDYHHHSQDITEGKFGLPIIHAIHNDTNSEEVLHILKQRTDDNEVIKDCISRMQTLGSLQYTKDVMRSLDNVAREEVAKLGSNPLMDTLLNELLPPKAATN